MPASPLSRTFERATRGRALSYVMIPLKSFFAMVLFSIFGWEFVAEMPMPFLAMTDSVMRGDDPFETMMPAVSEPTTVVWSMCGWELFVTMIPALVLSRIMLLWMRGEAPFSIEMPFEQFSMRLFEITTVLSTPTSTIPVKLAPSITLLLIVTGPVGRFRMYCGSSSPVWRSTSAATYSLNCTSSERTPSRIWTPISTFSNIV